MSGEAAVRRWEILASEIETACSELHSLEQQGRGMVKDIRRLTKRIKIKMAHVQEAQP